MKKGWPTAPLGDLCAVVAGGTPSRSQPQFYGGDIRWVKISDMTQGVITDTEEKISKEGLDNSTAKLLPAGTVLVSIFATIGRTATLGTQAATNQAIVGVSPKCPNTLASPFLRYFLDHSVGDLTQQGRGVAQSNINGKILKSVPVPTPPLSEQKRIVAILDAADELRGLREQADRRTADLIPALFHEMFGDPATNPKRYPRVPISELATIFSDGPFGSNLKSSHYTINGIRVIRLQNIGVRKFADNDKAFISEQHFANLIKHECLPGDVLIGTLGDPNLRACIQPSWIKRAINKADCIQCRPDDRKANASYLCALLNQPSTERMAQDLIVGQTRLRISMGRLKGLRVPVPPLSLQNNFAARVAAILVMESGQAASRRRLNDLFQSLLHRAFRGDL